MEEQYRGNTIIANSTQRLDGRWLPIAELEVHFGGAVRVRPPVVAKPHEVRRTKEEADVVAIQMAKQWIDEHG